MDVNGSHVRGPLSHRGTGEAERPVHDPGSDRVRQVDQSTDVEPDLRLVHGHGPSGGRVGHGIEVLGVGPDQLRGASKRSSNSPVEPFLEQRQDLVADPRPQEPGIAVHGVLLGAESKGPAERLHLVPGRLQERPQGRESERGHAAHRRHPSQRVQTPASDEGQENRLGLVVDGMSQRGHLSPLVDGRLGERSITGQASPGLDGLSFGGPVRRLPHDCGHPQSPRLAPDVLSIFGRVGTEAVIEVERYESDPEEAPKTMQRVEKAGRVGTAGARHQDQLARLEHAVFACGGADPLQNTGDRGRAPLALALWMAGRPALGAGRHQSAVRVRRPAPPIDRADTPRPATGGARVAPRPWRSRQGRPGPRRR